MKKPIKVIALALIAGTIFLALSAMAVAKVDEPRDNSVSTVGKEGLQINKIIFATYHFHPAVLRVNQGDQVTFLETTGDVHTVSILAAADLPTDTNQVFSCGNPPAPAFNSPPGPCFQFLAGHFPQGPAPPAPTSSIVPVLNVGNPGFDAPGDSVFLGPHQSVTVTISAAPGTTLHYLCAIHPWMQGTIVVQGSN